MSQYTDTDADTDADADTDTEEQLHIYLAFGQSNMSGQGEITEADRTADERFLVLAAAQHSGRTVGEFYPATPPLAHSDSQMGPADFLGRKMVAELPENIKVAVAVAVFAIGGVSIELFDPATKDSYISWARSDPNESWWMQYLDQYGWWKWGRLPNNMG